MVATGTVHVVDDDAAMRDSLRVLLESFGFAVRTHDNAIAFIAEAASATGCVLTDIQMPGVDGLELQRRLHQQRVHLPVIVMTGEGDIAVAVRAMREGAVDFLEKPFDDSSLLESVTRALAQSEKQREAEALSSHAARRLATLTPREREVFDLLVAGLPNKAIANRLTASPRTIEVHRARVLEKLRAKALPDLVRLVLAAEPGEGGRR